MKHRICIHCDVEFLPFNGKPGKVNECADCAQEVVHRYTGNMIYDHKTGPSLQVNSDPRLTAYINNATKLRCKGSNLGNNLKVDSSLAKSSGMAHGAGGRSRRRE